MEKCLENGQWPTVVSHSACVAKIPSHIWDTTGFINKLRGLPTLPTESLLVTPDASSFYTNIPHEEGITACEDSLSLRESQVPPTTDLCQLIRFILSMNAFSFNGAYYLQTHSMALGT